MWKIVYKTCFVTSVKYKYLGNIFSLSRQVVRRTKRKLESQAQDVDSDSEQGAVGGDDFPQVSVKQEQDDESDSDDYIVGVVKVEPPGAYDFLWEEIDQEVLSFFYYLHFYKICL